MDSKPIAMVVCKDLAIKLAMMDKIGKRQLMVQSLINSYGLNKLLKLVPSKSASVEDLKTFHSIDYIEFLSNPKDTEEEEEYGLGYDCPVHPNLLSWVLSIAGGTLSAAECLLKQEASVAINWAGGWHHAQRNNASGFCYVNDIVLAIHRLQSRFKKILYVDLDVHHGDGVENAFSATNKVVTFSIHKHEPGYFPGTGSELDIGTGRGKYFSINIPLREGVTDMMYRKIFRGVFPSLVEAFKPDCIVVQCGGDSLAGDPLGGFNLTHESIASCVEDVIAVNVPVLVLGGGGYNLVNTAKCWTQITSRIASVSLDSDIPDCDPFFLDYGPDYCVEIDKTSIKNQNTEESVNSLIEHTLSKLEKIENFKC